MTGAAGYIGSHACRALLLAGVERLVAVDSLVRGHSGAVSAVASLDRASGSSCAPCRMGFARLDIRETDALAALMAAERVAAVLHFAGLAQVAESTADPDAYWSTNVDGTRSVLHAMRHAGVGRLVFSSSAAVYGAPLRVPIPEEAPLLPVNPYGETKLAAERLVAACVTEAAAARVPFTVATLRYFNVAGAAADGSLGEDHRPETHLIPSALQVALGRRGELQVFGDDYATPDGTCIRDYVHVDDLVRAHIAVLRDLREHECRTYNVGLGRGFSVREVLDACQRVSGRRIPTRMCPRRAGDPAVLVADAARIQRDLAWKAECNTLEAMVDTAWQWMRSHRAGYAATA